MHDTVFFISDVHLCVSKPKITHRFVNFLRSCQYRAQALYILGDLFDVWVGDDDNTALSQTIRHAFSDLTQQGVAVYIQKGNRDFLLGQDFCQMTGVTLLADVAVIDLFDYPTMLTHGDLLCTDDEVYQAFRRTSRTPSWQQAVLVKPLWLRLLAARWYRLKSFFHKRQQQAAIMDVNADTMAMLLRQYQARRLIHGHTHKPAIHHENLDGKMIQRFVLAPWENDFAQVLAWKEGNYQIESI